MGQASTTLSLEDLFDAQGEIVQLSPERPPSNPAQRLLASG